MVDAQTLTKTIEYVQPNPRRWEKDGELKGFFVTVNFADNCEGSMFSPPNESKLAEVVASLEALKDSPTEFSLKPKDDFNGIPQWNIASYPGKPEGLSSGGGGGGRGGGGMSHAQAGYMAAASALGPVFAVKDTSVLEMANTIIALGETITQALFDRKPPQGTQTEAKTETSATSDAPAGTSSSSAVSLAQIKQLKELVAKHGWDENEVKTRTDGKNLSGLDAEEATILIEAWGAEA